MRQCETTRIAIANTDKGRLKKTLLETIKKIEYS